MRLALRILLNLLNAVSAQIDQIDNELRPHAKHRAKFQESKRLFNAALRGFGALNDEMGDEGVN